MQSSALVVALVVATCCVASVVGAVPTGVQAGGVTHAGNAPEQIGAATLQTDGQPDSDNTITRIDLSADGSATWEITFRTRLSNDTDAAEYERFQERFRSNTSRYLGPFADRMTGVVAAANDSSPRAMRATDFAAETTIQEVPRRWGIVRFRFTWVGFAAAEDDAVIVGDIFAGGFFIAEDDALAITAPEGYTIESVSPAPDEAGDGVVEWQGRVDFNDRQPSVRAVPANEAGGDGGDDSDGNAGAFPAAAVASVAALAVLAGITYAVRTGRVTLGDNGEDGTAPGGGGGNDPTDGAAAKHDATATAPASAPVADAAEGETLLTDEDRVKNLIEARGGRMKQSAIVDELDWSKSKGSRVLSGMSEAGEIEKLRIGRENVIDLKRDGDGG